VNKVKKFLLKLLPKKKRFQNTEKGLLLFLSTSEAIKAETILKKEGYRIKIVAPPQHLRKGCDLSIEFPLTEQLGIERALKTKGIFPLDIVVYYKEGLEPQEIYKKKDFGKYLMVRVANMKLTFDKETKKIVNISGGGCPDVPFLAKEMIGKSLNEAPSPRDLGYTVCAYALAVALEKAKGEKSYKNL